MSRSMPVMSAIEFIKEKLKKFPQLNYHVEGNKITIEPLSSSGFSMWLVDNNPGFTVGFDGWHEEFDRQDDALDCFGFGLSEKCRLKVVKRGNTPSSWTLQSWNGTDWNNDSTTALIFIPFWRKKKVEYLSNKIIK